MEELEAELAADALELPCVEYQVAAEQLEYYEHPRCYSDSPRVL